ncbi:aberrant root formation protein 4 isoform X1 [Cucumis melo var. makuwa]|uniref:Aberrant root formation protein 4 isoform X1 n=1 Tax=Cucumis melo var. makuwa TaxID=1194695 RepID=A0A5A7VCA5_CUCMM|nr:aberrant root formation protein 4 isoform X1 [Cucumis melo var. makuwa]
MEKADDHCLSKLQLTVPSDDRPSVLRLRELLAACSKSIENGDTHQSEALISELVNYLDCISEAAETELDNGDTESDAFEVLNEIYRFISSPSLDQGTIDTLSFDLPKAVSKFIRVGGCLEIVDSIIDRFVTLCSPRDMLSVLCEALDLQTTKAATCAAPFLSGLSKVIRSIQRRHFEQIKVAVPVVLNALKAVDFETSEGDVNCDTLYARAMDIASSIQSVCVKLVDGKVQEKLHSLLGLYVLQIMALFSVSMSHEVSSCLPFVSKLSSFLPFCGLSYAGLITGFDIDKISNNIIGEDEDDYTACFSYIKHGACLSVLWGFISEEVAQAADEKVNVLKDELTSKQTERWKAIGMFRHILSFAALSWKLKKHAIDFLLCIHGSESFDDKQSDYISYMPSLFAALQAVQIIIMYAPDATLRRNGFDLFKKLLADIPYSQRFDMFRALIMNSDSPSMVGLLLDLVKGEMHAELCQKRAAGSLQVDTKARSEPSFCTPSILELVELVLRPPKGGPPVLPEQSDAVLSALNLYRYVLITEATGNTNYTGVLLKSNLQKSYNEWLLPLRTLVTGIMSENKTDYDEITVDIECALNPVELVLYRCIDLVEEKLR